MSIERAFGILTSRWRFLSHHVFIKNTRDVCRVIVVCCILHNFCININDPDFPIEENLVANNIEDENFENNGDVGLNFSAGRARRDQLNRWFSQR